jgi:dihydropteroate synthase
MNKLNDTKIVGILNLSPESFGSESYTDLDAIIERVELMVQEGADCIDIGAQSTKPGSVQLTVPEELHRLENVVSSVKAKYPTLLVSIDTTRFEAAQLAVQEGADIVNDISGGRFDPTLAKLIVGSDKKYIVTHSQGSFGDMHKKYEYADIIAELKKYFEQRVLELESVGVHREQIILDPGIGFSKSGPQNIEILKRLDELHTLNLPLYVGISRKKFIGTMINQDDPQERDIATTVLHAYCLQKGVSYIRTHNVRYLKECLQVHHFL